MQRTKIIKIEFRRSRHIEVAGFEVLTNEGLSKKEIQAIARHFSEFAKRLGAI